MKIKIIALTLFMALGYCEEIHRHYKTVEVTELTEETIEGIDRNAENDPRVAMLFGLWVNATDANEMILFDQTDVMIQYIGAEKTETVWRLSGDNIEFLTGDVWEAHALDIDPTYTEMEIGAKYYVRP